MTSLTEAESLLRGLASVFEMYAPGDAPEIRNDVAPSVEARYRAIVEQIPAVIFMADLERGAGQAYVSPQIEETLGFSQTEWLQDPVRWYQQIHPADKDRWSVEAADMLLDGKPLRSCYRVLAKDGHVVWFQCEARMMRRSGGEPWFIHGIAFDITGLKEAEAALQEERNVASGILDAVGTLVIVLDSRMRIVRFNRICEQTSGFTFRDVCHRFLWDLLPVPEQAERFRAALLGLREGRPAPDFETLWEDRAGDARLISWAITLLRGPDDAVQFYIASGTDITDRKRLEAALLEASSREQRRIGQDLHDGLGQLLTGIGFMSKAHEHRLAEGGFPESAEAAKIVKHVNDAIRKARELARGLMPISPGPDGLAESLEQLVRDVQDVFGVSCHFECTNPISIPDVTIASHLYHIAQEAIHNGIKHGKAARIEVILSTRNGGGSLVVHDTGGGIPAPRAKGAGMGLDIMAHRAEMIGGSLEISSSDKGTTVACHFPGGVR
jgi:PAS domain S-box-containing protein